MARYFECRDEYDVKHTEANYGPLRSLRRGAESYWSPHSKETLRRDESQEHRRESICRIARELEQIEYHERQRRADHDNTAGA